MQGFLKSVYKVDVGFQVVSMVALVVIILVTLVDVIMRNLGHPIVGSMEIVSFLGAVVIGFAIPYASWKRVHVYVDVVLEKLKPSHRKVFDSATRCLGIALFVFIGTYFIVYGLDLRRTHEVSPSFKLPYYPIPWGLAVASFLQSMTLIADLVKITRQGGEK
jgi:TRAP-type C4-dicarboxylate transport system permease small subunit